MISEKRSSFMRQSVRQIPLLPILLKGPGRYGCSCRQPGKRQRKTRQILDITSGYNIYMSIILRPDIEPKDTTLITIMAAVACAIALRRVTGISISIKWPNDLMVSDRKIGGILTEMKTAREKIISVVIGIGINVNGDLDSFPEEIRGIATSVKNETGKPFSRERIIAEILNEMDRWYPLLKGLARRRSFLNGNISLPLLAKKSWS